MAYTSRSAVLTEKSDKVFSEIIPANMPLKSLNKGSA